MRKRVLLFFGGGQVPNGNFALATLTLALIRAERIVYGVHERFKGLMDISNYELLDEKIASKMMFEFGTYLGTCRNKRLTEQDYKELVNLLTSLKIEEIYVIGGDGSLRATHEMHEHFKDMFKIKFIPATVDGINGSTAIGYEPALAETNKITECMAADCFSLFDTMYKGSRIAIVEVQGRNRNDLLTGVVSNICKKGASGNTLTANLNLVVIPCGYNWTTSKLLDRVNGTKKNTLVLVSEGAIPQDNSVMWQFEGMSIGMKLENIIKRVGIRDARAQIVGYLTQMNTSYCPNSEKEIRKWCTETVNQPDSGVIANVNGKFEKVSFEEMVSKNKNSSEPVYLTLEEEKEFKKYLL